MHLKFLSFIALIYLSTTICPADTNIQNVVADTMNFINPQLGGQLIVYTFKNAFLITPKVSIAIQRFQIQSGNPSNFSLSAYMIKQNDITFRFFRMPNLWNKLRINFFATIRSDLIIGSGYSQYANGVFNTSAISSVNFQTQIPNYSRSIIRVFLNGFSYKGSLIDVQITGRKIQAKQISVTIDCKNNFALFQIYYSFIVFAPGNFPYASYGGYVALSEFSGFQYEDAHKIIYNSNYQLYGLNKITIIGSQSIQFASLIDQNQVVGLYSSRKFDQLNLIYIILGVSPVNSCSRCSNSSYNSAYGLNCLASCPQGTYNFLYSDKGSACRLCSLKLNQVLNNGKCVCNSQNSVNKDGICVLTKGQQYNFLGQIDNLSNRSNNAGQSTINSGAQTIVNVPTNIQTNQTKTTTSTTNTITIINSLPINYIPSNINTSNIPTTTVPLTWSNSSTNNNTSFTNFNNTTIPNTNFNNNNNQNYVQNNTLATNVINDGTCQNQNQYWTGYRCACKVGYQNQSNSCVSLRLIKVRGWVSREPAADLNDDNYNNSSNVTQPVVQHNCYMVYQYFNGLGCVCVQNYFRINGVCTLDANYARQTCQKQANKQWINNTCICKTSFILLNQICILNTINNCPVNSYSNGLGICICNSGYYNDTQTKICIKGTPCPPNSIRNSNGTCVCDAGLMMYDGYCSRCPQGAVWNTQSSKCLYVCGQKAIYNQTISQCQCQTGYGIYDNICSICPANFFISNNYCVQCPLNSIYNRSLNRCRCIEGYLLNNQGFCIKICKQNQIYSVSNGTCKCSEGLGRLNNISSDCQICPAGTYPLKDTEICSRCTGNLQQIDGKCVCKKGFTLNNFGVCIACDTLADSFLVNGYCATCAGNLIYNKQSKKCECSVGKLKIGSKCIDACKADELLDDNNYCYSCPINEYVDTASRACACHNGYVRNNSTGRCELQCLSQDFIYQDKCAQCPLTLIYRSQIKGCSCSDGFYLNIINGRCQKVILQPIFCDFGFFFSQFNGCIKCPSECISCTVANACTSCQNGFKLTNGRCLSFCGDGLIIGLQGCDDANTNNSDGCSSNCTVQPFYTCTGQPSVCRYSGPAICGNGRIQGLQECDDGNTLNNDGCLSTCRKQTINPINEYGNLSIFGQVNTNINNVYVVLKTPKKYKFANEVQMKNFLQASFPNTTTNIPSVYCFQRQQPDLDLFQCLAIYSSGIPNKRFGIVFSYNYYGDTGRILVQADPMKSVIPTRSVGGKV